MDYRVFEIAGKIFGRCLLSRKKKKLVPFILSGMNLPCHILQSIRDTRFLRRPTSFPGMDDIREFDIPIIIMLEGLKETCLSDIVIQTLTNMIASEDWLDCGEETFEVRKAIVEDIFGEEFQSQSPSTVARTVLFKLCFPPCVQHFISGVRYCFSFFSFDNQISSSILRTHQEANSIFVVDAFANRVRTLARSVIENFQVISFQPESY